FRNTPIGGDFTEEHPPSEWVVRRESDGFTKIVRTHSTTPATGLLMDLLTDFGHAIRKCEEKECGRLYLAGRQRQQFCSRRCQNRVSLRAKQKRDAQADTAAKQAQAGSPKGPHRRPRPRKPQRAPRGVTTRA